MIIHCNLEHPIFSQSHVAGSMSPKKPQKPSQSSPALETLQKKKAGSVAGSTICQRKPPRDSKRQDGTGWETSDCSCNMLQPKGTIVSFLMCRLNSSLVTVPVGRGMLLSGKRGHGHGISPNSVKGKVGATGTAKTATG